MFIKIESVSKSFGHSSGKVIALSDITMETEKGEFLAIEGPSGSGKSTLLTVIAGLQSPDSGRVIIDDISLYEDLDVERRARFRGEYIGFVFQSFNLIPYLTAMENVMLPLACHKYSRKTKRQMAEKALELTGLSDRKEHLPSELSGGQQQRAAIARAIVNEPMLIIADEPTGNLDTATRNEVINLFSELGKKKMTVIMVSHDPEVAKAAKRRIKLLDGRILQKEPFPAH